MVGIGHCVTSDSLLKLVCERIIQPHRLGTNMALTLEQFGLDRLTADERVELVELLCESMPNDRYTPPQLHIEILQQRLNQPKNLSQKPLDGSRCGCIN